jgi:hypothetical protein
METSEFLIPMVEFSPLFQTYWPIYGSASREVFREFLKLGHDCFLQYLSKSPPPPPSIRGASARLRVMAYLYGASRSHSLDTLHSVGLIWTSDQPEAETSAWQNSRLIRDKYPCFRLDLNPLRKWSQIYALDGAATEIGPFKVKTW